jgi:hypothetical protein
MNERIIILFILMHIIHLLHLLVLVCICLYMKSCFLFDNNVQYAIEMELFQWVYEIITNLPTNSTLWAI